MTPTLHEIAAMPFPASVEAMRKYYVPDWAKPVPEGMERKALFVVDVVYTVTREERQEVDIEAWTADEAEAAAVDQISRDEDGEGEIEFFAIKVSGGPETESVQ